MPGALEKGTAAAKSSVKRVLGRAGIKIVRTNAHGGIDEFIPFEETMQAAQSAGLSVGDYIDGVMNRTPGATQHTIDEFAGLASSQTSRPQCWRSAPVLGDTWKRCSNTVHQTATRSTKPQRNG